ncbi:hypothetical protein ACFXG4_03810 [Nocardia sp. NPDC059246]|uniref:hypothetical protein n=1 Tax=unclassified Nocardia TaxID=2637762 RepID=UPI00367801FD
MRAINGRTQGWAVLLTLPDARMHEYAFVGTWARAMDIADGLVRDFAVEAA